MKHAACVGPLEGTTDDVVPVFAELVDHRGELIHVGARAMAERASGQDAKPDLDLVKPAAVRRGKDEPNAGVFAEPLCRRIAGPRADVIGDDDDWTAPVEPDDLVEETQDHRRRAIGRHPEQHAAITDVKCGKYIARAPALVLKFESRWLPAAHRSCSSRSAQGLNPGFLVDAQHGRAGRRRHVELADSSCFRIKIRIIGIEPISDAMRLERH